MKKVLIIIVGILLLSLVTFLGWYLFLRTPEVPVEEIIRKALPFGSSETAQRSPTQPTRTTGGTENNEFKFDKFNNPASNLFRVSQEPVAGAVVFNRTASTTVARHVDRATGHIYETNLGLRGKTKITNQTLPKIYEAYFKPDGNAVLIRSLRENSDVVENTLITIIPPKAASTDSLHISSSTPQNKNITSIAVGPGNVIFYALRDPSLIVTSTFNSAGDKTLFSSPFKDWRLASAGKTLLAYTKASASAPGYAYTVNTSSGALIRILGPLNGLVVVPNASGDRVLYSYEENGRTKTFTKNLKSGRLSEILPSTLAEKCVWSIKNVDMVFCAVPTDSPEASEPDNWYKGRTHFSDRLWLFDTKVNIARALVEPKLILDVDIDADNIKLSPNEDYLVFTNNTDLSLWALKLEPF